MKKLYLACLAALLLSACELEVSENGDFDGLWQLTALDSVGTGSSVDMRTSGEFWAVQMRLLEVRNSRGQHRNQYFRFTLADGWLTLRTPNLDENGMTDDSTKIDVSSLRRYGISRVDERFHVLTLTGSTMVLQNEAVKLSFRKY